MRYLYFCERGLESDKPSLPRDEKHFISERFTTGSYPIQQIRREINPRTLGMEVSMFLGENGHKVARR